MNEEWWPSWLGAELVLFLSSQLAIAGAALVANLTA